MSNDVNTSLRHTSSIGGGAIVEVSQGATVAIAWICANTTLGTYCPSSALSTWSGATSAPGVLVGSDPTTTYGSAVANEFFSTSSSTPVGIYPATVCLQSYQSSDTLPICTSFLISVVSPPDNNPISIPTVPLPGVTVELQMSQAGSGGKIIPGEGHLYVQIYTAGVATTQLQGGPNGSPPGWKLAAEKFTQFPYTQPGVDITPYVSVALLYSRYNAYLQYQHVGNLPTYDPLEMNSNTFAYGLLAAAGVPAGNINSAIQTLIDKSGLLPTGFANYAAVVPCFTVSSSLPRAPGAAPMTTFYGGCSNNRRHPL